MNILLRLTEFLGLIVLLCVALIVWDAPVWSNVVCSLTYRT